uniref:Uncharacterized protein n=1 Tax=Arion vulgaris TaxID=1028688 RepID=A0A0B7A240_9EUPU
MCPKVHSSLREQNQESMEANQRHNMTSALWHTIQEDKNDSGLDSINLPSFRMYESDVATIENSFVNMKINNEVQTARNDSGVYTSEQYRHGNVETLCDEECIDDDITMSNTVDCNTSRRDSRVQLHIRSEHVACLYEGDKDGDNKLHLSIINGHGACSHLLINLAQEYDCLSFSNHLRQTPLHLAVLTHQRTIVRRLICGGATVLAQDKQGDTPLHIACRLGDIETVKHLLTPVQYEETLQNRYTIPYQRVPQDLRVRNYNGHTCLHIAASSGHHNVVQMLLEAGADINIGDGKSGRTVLHQAVDRGDMELVELLLSYTEINVKKQDYAGLTPVHLAYGRRYMNIVRIICGLSDEYDGIHLNDRDMSIQEDDDISDDSDNDDTLCVYR